MPKSLDSLLSFTAGEFSPRLDARADQVKYKSAMRQCLNMIPYKTGGLTRRPGTQYMGTGKYTDSAGATSMHAVGLRSFEYSPSTSFILEFGHRYVRFYSNGQQVQVTSAPSWVPSQQFIAGAYCSYLGVIYYAPGGAYTSMPPTSAGIINVIWFAQTILEQPTPYCGIYYPTGAVPGWVTSTIYFIGDYVTQGGVTYRCQVYHLSGTFATDLANGDWLAATAPANPFQTDIYYIAPCQINDVVYFAHPQYPPYSLTRYTNISWIMKQVAFLTPPLLDQNSTDTILTPSVLRGSVTLTASAPAWVADNYYAIGNSVSSGGTIYNCIVPNVSSNSFTTDNLLGYWQAQTIFNNQHVGSTWQLASLRNSAYIEYDGTAMSGFSAGTSGQIQCLGQWEVHTYGVWSADIAIQRSLDGGQTWDTVRSVTGRSDRNVDITGTAAVLGIYQLVISNVAVPVNAGATNPRVVFECVNAFLYGLVKITAVSGAYTATGTVLTELSDTNPLPAAWVSGQAYTPGNTVSYQFVSYTALNNVTSTTPPSQDPTNWSYTQPGGTEYWSEGAWSNYRGYPQGVTSFQQRVVYGGSGYEPQRIWASVTNDIENFALGDQTLATDSLAFDLNAPGRGPIQWLVAQTDLFAGFAGAEWVINSGGGNPQQSGGNATLTATAVNAVEHSSWGSAAGVRPAVVGDAVIYTQRQATSIRQMMFSIYTNKYMSQDLTTLSDHMFTSGIVQIAYQPRWRKQSNIWTVTQQGTLCGMTYELDQEVFGWHRHQTGYGQTDSNGVSLGNDNGFESVAVIDGQGTSEDEVWVVVNRTINGAQTRFIERLNPNNWEETFTGAPNPTSPSLPYAFYVDCGMTVLNPGTTTIPNMGYLNGRYVVGLADGWAFGPVLVSGGVAQLPPGIPSTVGVVQIGLPLPYTVQPMRIDADPRAGNTQGLKKQFSDLYVRVMNSLGGVVSNGTVQYPIWESGLSYVVGNLVRSPSTLQTYYCFQNYSGTTDPASATGNFSQTYPPVYNSPVPIPYPQSRAQFPTPVLVTTPTDLRVTPMLNPDIGNDPTIILQANDPLPLTVLALICKYDIIGTP